MGSGGLSARQIRGDERTIIELFMPVYYVHENGTKDDIALAKIGWNKIIRNELNSYKEYEKMNPNAPPSCISWFYSTFYDRLFDVHPLCKPLFTKSMIVQGTFLVKMISLTLMQLGDQKHFMKLMQGLAIRHCQLGVKAVEYGIVGGVLFYALARVLGEEYTPEVDTAWRRIYCSMIRIIIPLCVEFERDGTINRKRREVAEYYYNTMKENHNQNLEVR